MRAADSWGPAHPPRRNLSSEVPNFTHLGELAETNATRRLLSYFATMAGNSAPPCVT